MSRPIEASTEQFRVQPDQPAPVDTPAVETGYSRRGEAEDTSSQQCVAKETFHPGSGLRQYFVKSCTFGVQAGRLYDPLGVPADELRRHDACVGRDRYRWKSVSAEAFASYLTYLRTSNPAHLRQAERV
jgi:hypothetical protein